MTKKLSKEFWTTLNNYSGFPKPPDLAEITDPERLKELAVQYEDSNQPPPELPKLENLIDLSHEAVKESGEAIVIFSDSMKGGVGKSTTAFNLATSLVHMGFRVCIVDTCENQNCIQWNQARPDDLPMITVVPCLDVRSLGKIVKGQAVNHDFIVIDGTPGTTTMTTKGIALAHVVIIPIKPQSMALDTLPKNLDNYYLACEEKSALAEEDVEIPAIILCSDDEPRTVMSRKSKFEILKLPLPRLYHRVDHQVAFAETYSEGVGINEGRHANGEAAKSFSKVVHEFLTFIIKNIYNG